MNEPDQRHILHPFPPDLPSIISLLYIMGGTIQSVMSRDYDAAYEVFYHAIQQARDKIDKETRKKQLRSDLSVLYKAAGEKRGEADHYMNDVDHTATKLENCIDLWIEKLEARAVDRGE